MERAMQAEQTVLRLIVRNHPGVMSHLCGLFARRGFNVEGILCVPLEDGACSAILLLVADDRRNAQIVAQLRKLEDVIEVHPDPGTLRGDRWRSRASATPGDISSRATGTRPSASGAGVRDRRPGR